MFDNVTISKAFKVMDNIKNVAVDACTFNATLINSGSISVNMNINYPNLYSQNKDAILIAYRKFASDVTAIAVSMGLATTIEDDPSILQSLDKVRDEMTKVANEIFNQVLATLEDITINPVPIMEVGANNNPFASGVTTPTAPTPTAPYNTIPTYPNGMR